jgi:hypothetical protein
VLTNESNLIPVASTRSRAALTGKTKENFVKSITSVSCLILCLLCLLAGASAQETLNFTQLPLVNTPSPMPTGYGHLTWGNFYYVNPYGWTGAGPGYRLGQHGGDVVMVGSKDCRLYDRTCFGILSDANGFQLVSAVVAGGYTPTQVIATAYVGGTLLGSTQYFVGTGMRTINFPASWGISTEVVFQVSGAPGNLVVYSLTAYTLGGQP